MRFIALGGIVKVSQTSSLQHFWRFSFFAHKRYHRTAKFARKRNSAGFKYGLGVPNPENYVLKRYHELGGEIITVGADAHKPEHVAYDFDKVSNILKDAGFMYYTVFENRVPAFIKL